ncbi:MAG: hypothetical protein WBM03_05105 [Steroidobacteraceae bacterium]
MTAAIASAELLALYPALQGLDANELAAVLAGAELVDLPAGTALFGAGSRRAADPALGDLGY